MEQLDSLCRITSRNSFCLPPLSREHVMRTLVRLIAVFAVFPVLAATPKATTSPLDDHDPVVIVYKDGHRQTLAAGEIERIDLKTPATIFYKDGHRERLHT